MDDKKRREYETMKLYILMDSRFFEVTLKVMMQTKPAFEMRFRQPGLQLSGP